MPLRLYMLYLAADPAHARPGPPCQPLHLAGLVRLLFLNSIQLAPKASSILSTQTSAMAPPRPGCVPPSMGWLPTSLASDRARSRLGHAPTTRRWPTRPSTSPSRAQPPSTVQWRGLAPSAPRRRRLSRSVPATPTAPTPATFSGLVPLTSDQGSSKLPPEEFHSKSRSLTISISPRPSSDTFRPGQRLMVYVRRNSGSARRKYGTVGIVLSGRFVERRNGQSHEFLKVIKSVISGGAAEAAAAGVRMIGHGGDEWAVDLIIPEHATCVCGPGSLPLPSAGINSLVSNLISVWDYFMNSSLRHMCLG